MKTGASLFIQTPRRPFQLILTNPKGSGVSEVYLYTFNTFIGIVYRLNVIIKVYL